MGKSVVRTHATTPVQPTDALYEYERNNCPYFVDGVGGDCYACLIRHRRIIDESNVVVMPCGKFVDTITEYLAL